MFHPYKRDPETLARPWAVPGTPQLMHRVGGLEKEDVTGNISYTPSNHGLMTEVRAAKVDGIAADIPPVLVDRGGAGSGGERGRGSGNGSGAPGGNGSGDPGGNLGSDPGSDLGSDPGGSAPSADIAVLSWGSVWGAVTSAIGRVRAGGGAVDHLHLTHLSPLPADLGEQLARYRKVLVPEMNLGQLASLIRSRYLIDVVGINKVEGVPFTAGEIAAAIAGVADDD